MISQTIKARERPAAVPGTTDTRIVLIVPQFPRLSETFIVSKFLGLLTAGHDVHVVCTGSEAAEWRRFPELRAVARRRVHVIASTRRVMVALLYPYVLLRCLVSAPAATARYFWSGWREFGLDVLRRFYIDAELIRLRPDIVHFEFGALAVGRMYLKRLLPCKIVVSFRGYDINFVGLEHDHHYQDVWENADALHFLGCDLWRRAQRRGCPEWIPHFLIPPAIDSQFFSPSESLTGGRRERAGQPLQILSVGRMEWKKGYEYALQAIAMLRNQGIDCRYRIIGGGNAIEAVAFARHQLGLDHAVEFIGPVGRSDVRSHMERSDIFLHSAVSEGFCNSVLEAQAMGLPVVCSDADGLSENVVDGITGFVVERRSASALAQSLSVLVQNAVLRRQMGEAGRRRVVEQFGLQDQIRAFGFMYSQIRAADPERTN